MKKCSCECCEPGCQRKDLLLDAIYGSRPDDYTTGCPDHIYGLVPDCDASAVYIAPHDTSNHVAPLDPPAKSETARDESPGNVLARPGTMTGQPEHGGPVKGSSQPPPSRAEELASKALGITDEHRCTEELCTSGCTHGAAAEEPLICTHCACADCETGQREPLLRAEIDSLRGQLKNIKEISGKYEDRYFSILKECDQLKAQIATARDEGRAQGRADVGKYSNAIGKIESALGIVGAHPLSDTVAAVERLVAQQKGKK